MTLETHVLFPVMSARKLTRLRKFYKTISHAVSTIYMRLIYLSVSLGKKTVYPAATFYKQMPAFRRFLLKIAPNRKINQCCKEATHSSPLSSSARVY